MTTGPPGGSDVWSGMIRPTDIEEMDHQGKTVSSRGGLHYCRIMINLKKPPLDDINFRHALAHLVPKDRIIGNLFKYIVVKVDTPVPPAQALWYNDKVDPHAYSPVEAEAILADAGYKKIDGVWKGKTGGTLPSLRFYVPLEVVAPTSFTIGRMLVEEAQAIGLNNLVLTPMDFSTYGAETYTFKNFELSWVCHGLGRFPTHLYFQYSSKNYYPPGTHSPNPHGNYDPDLDAQLDILWTSLDHSAKVVAVRRAQELLAGGTTTSPLPHNADPTLQSIPAIPVYSRNYYDTQNPDLRGAVNMFGYGIANSWSLMNMYWKTTNNYRPGTSSRMIVWIEGEFPERLNPLWATTVYAWDFMEMSYDGLMATNPWTHRDESWLATSWSYYAVAGGMDVTFNLKDTDPSDPALDDDAGVPITWQDGKEISVSDIKFSLDFLRNYEISLYWASMKFYDPANTVIIDARTIRARLTSTSQWLVYAVAGNALLLPSQVWTQDPRDGSSWGTPGSVEAKTKLTTFDPSALAYPTAYNVAPGPISLPTQLFGTGSFILQHSTSFINGLSAYGDLAANRNYFMTTSDIQDKLENMFWRSGDIAPVPGAPLVGDDKVYAQDIANIGLFYLWGASGMPPVQPAPDPSYYADITSVAGGPPDRLIDIDDFATTSKYFGETETVPYEVGTPP
jgi:ABC-type transport system substrate-binding protein